MATPSPRKFQEKIALLQQKEAEGKIAYDNIMNEVQGLRMHPKSSGQPKGQQLLPPQAQPSPFQQPPPQHASRPPQSGSLPDFSINLPAVLACDPLCWSKDCGSPELRGVALQPADALRTHQDQGRVPECYVQGPLQGAMQDLNNLQNQVYSGVPHQRVSVASQIRSHQHISPHLGNSPAYPVLLSPPHASESLLRSNSDSSLHQNLLHGGKAANNRKVSAPVEVGRMDPGLGVNLYGHMRHSQELQNRPKSGCELTHPSEITDVRGPRINHVQRSPNIPIPTTITNTGGAGPGGGGGVGTLPNTGSLPDLTQVQYLQPMNTPIPDTDLNTISPGSARLGTTFPTGVLGDPYSSGQASPRGTSPGPSPSVMRKKPQKPYQTTQTNHRGAHHSQNKGMTVDNSTIVDPHLANSGLNLFGQPLSPSGSHPPSPNQLSFMDYRNPVSPQLSPRSSPGPCHTLQTGGLGSYSSNSPSDSRSAPPSPSAPQASPASSPGVTISKPFTYNEYHTHAQTNQLNQQFEQCKMIDNSPVPASSYASSGSSNVHPQAGLLDISIEGNGFFSGAPSSSPGVPQGCPIPTSQAHQQPTGPPPPYPQTSTTQAHQQLQQTPQQQQEQQQQQQQQQEQQQQQQSQQQQTSQSQQQSQQQQQPQHHQQPSPTHPQHITQSPNHHPHHPPSPVQSMSSHAPPSPAQDPLSPQSHNHNMQHPQTPQTPQTPTFITPQVVVTIPPGEGTEDSLLQENISTWDMFASSPNPYEEGSFESSILDHMSRLDENELSMMVDQGAVDQLLVDQETEESFRRDHRTTSSTTTSGP